MDEWNFDLWLNVLTHLQTKENVICKFIIRDILSTLSTCKRLAIFRENDILWCAICKEFDDFEFIASRQIARNVSWKEMYIQRINNLYREEELVVGLVDRPEYKITIYIYGDGRCFMSKNLYTSNNDGEPIATMPVPLGTGAAQMLQIQNYEVGDDYGVIKDHEIIDVHAANMTILLLCQDGKVLEMLFTPSWMQEYNDYSTPMLVEFTELIGTDDRIRIIRTLMSSNIAISEQGKVFVWTVIQHPETMEIIRTRPLHIRQLDGALQNIYDVENYVPVAANEQNELASYTRILWREELSARDPMTGKRIFEDRYMDIDNSQIMLLIMENHFSEEDINEISQNITDADHA